jgi:hypothetical protein
MHLVVIGASGDGIHCLSTNKHRKGSTIAEFDDLFNNEVIHKSARFSHAVIIGDDDFTRSIMVSPHVC